LSEDPTTFALGDDSRPKKGDITRHRAESLMAEDPTTFALEEEDKPRRKNYRDVAIHRTESLMTEDPTSFARGESPRPRRKDRDDVARHRAESLMSEDPTSFAAAEKGEEPHKPRITMGPDELAVISEALRKLEGEEPLRDEDEDSADAERSYDEALENEEDEDDDDPDRPRSRKVTFKNGGKDEEELDEEGLPIPKPRGVLNKKPELRKSVYPIYPFTLSNTTKEEEDLFNEKWYFGAISGGEAEEILSTCNRDALLIRKSKNAGCYCLTKFAFEKKQFKHIAIVKLGNGYRLEQSPDKSIYSTLAQLIHRSPECIGFTPAGYFGEKQTNTLRVNPSSRELPSRMTAFTLRW